MKRSRHSTFPMLSAPVVVAALAALAVLFLAPAGPEAGPGRGASWPSWRGPLHTGVAPGADPPVRWSETHNVRWKTRLPGPGHASPIVWGNRIFVLAAIDGEEAAPERAEGAEPRATTPPVRFAVLALDRATGVVLWQTVVREEAPHEPGHETASHASASPVTDGKHVYAFFGSRGLYCLDMQGRVKWEADLGEMTTRNQFGEGASPALHGKTLVLAWDHEGDSFAAAFDKRSGKRLWKVARDEPTSWSTPLIVKDGKRDLAVISATRATRAYDLKTGETVWECAGLGLNCVPAPVAADGTVFVMSGYRDPAGLAIRYPGATGDIAGSDRVRWRIEGGTSYVPSPVLHDGKLYFLERFKGMLSSYDLHTGVPQYEKQRLGKIGNVYASPVAAAGRLYVIDRGGNALVARLGADFEILAENALDDSFDASPAIAGDALILRGHAWLYSLGR